MKMSSRASLWFYCSYALKWNAGKVHRRENLRFFGIPESTTGAEYTFEVMRRFLKEELELESAGNIEFQRAHRIGKKKVGEARPVIFRFLKFPERELVF